jgi:putative membrane protein
MLPSVFLSLGSELLGTSTGFPFGHYSYLSGLGYKIAGLVPFTIPLSWFYLGLVSYLIARAGLDVDQKPSLLRHASAIGLGALILTCWDFVLDPAMSQTALPFWYWQQPGAFFGMPYQNFAGWTGTGALFMTVAAVLWRNTPLKLDRSQLSVPLVVYLSNFAFAAVMSCASGFWIPVLLGLLIGVAPVLTLWWMAQPGSSSSASTAVAEATGISVAAVEVALK